MYKFLPSEVEFEHWMANKIQERRNKLVPFGTNEAGDPDKIAVVVHVIHNGELYGEGVNITDEQIYSQIEVLNEDYQRKNSDTIDTQLEFLNVASRLNIEFVLARQTIGGDPTTGIVRKEGPKLSYEISVSDRELLSSVSQWDPNFYLNIWVTNLRSPYIGLAQFPDYNYPGLDDEPNKDNLATDGMVIDYQAFGSIEKVPGLDLMPSYNLGRTSTHEIGHFFGLKHVWGDATGPVGCSVDDYVSDTPNSSNDYSGICTPQDPASCASNDMYQNFLYYTNDECMNIFTQGQVERMQVIIENAPRRASLINSIGTVYPDDMYFDLMVNAITAPGKVVCGGEIQPVVQIKNNGTMPAISFDIVYDLNSDIQIYSYVGDTIFSGETIDIQLPDQSIQNGNYDLSISLNNIPEDINGSNDTKSHVFAVDDQRDFIPLREQFDDVNINSTSWITINEDDLIGWELTNAPSASDENNSAFINFYNYEDRQQQDWLISPSLDFSQAVEASVVFKTSYAKNLDYNDQLRILISKDCGANFDDVLRTLNSNDLSIRSSEDYWEPVNQTEWSEHSIDLGNYVGDQNIRVAFLAVNDFGNNLYLDDVEFYATAEDKIVSTARNSFTLYPNPTTNGSFQLAFNTSGRQQVDIVIFDEMGRIVAEDTYSNTLNQTYYYDFTGFRSGVYFVYAKGADFVRYRKLVINR